MIPACAMACAQRDVPFSQVRSVMMAPELTLLDISAMRTSSATINKCATPWTAHAASQFVWIKLCGGARYLEVRLLLENNGLSNEENIAWEPFIRN